ncbi:MAG: hypothetical protein WCA08_07985 [Desulfoferrobacter sp.]
MNFREYRKNVDGQMPRSYGVPGSFHPATGDEKEVIHGIKP